MPKWFPSSQFVDIKTRLWSGSGSRFNSKSVNIQESGKVSVQVMRLKRFRKLCRTSAKILRLRNSPGRMSHMKRNQCRKPGNLGISPQFGFVYFLLSAQYESYLVPLSFFHCRSELPEQ
jgi:hypothetical protein